MKATAVFKTAYNSLSRIMSIDPPRRLVHIGLTAVFAGYFAVWLPGPAAGLRLIGVEMGEWIKFLGVGRSRDLFYLPPITLALMLVLLTAAWPYGRQQGWAMRLIAFGVSLLAFPSVEAVRFEPPSEWLLRITLVTLVLVSAFLIGLLTWRRLDRFSADRWVWTVTALIALAGVALPTWMYIAVRPTVSHAFGLPVGFGLGIWLNGLGHLVVVSAALIIRKRPTNWGENLPLLV